MMRQLDRIVVDECHIVLEANNIWRPQVLKVIKEIGLAETQVVYLTATLPPRLEPQFHEADRGGGAGGDDVSREHHEEEYYISGSGL